MSKLFSLKSNTRKIASRKKNCIKQSTWTEVENKEKLAIIEWN